MVGMHEIAGFKHLPDYLLRFQMLYPVDRLTLDLVEDRAVQLFKDQENAVVFTKNLE